MEFLGVAVQSTVPQVAQDALTKRAIDLLTDEVLVVLALMAVGMAVGMATVALYRTFEENASRSALKKLGAGAAGLWTLGIELAYLIWQTNVPWMVAGFAAIAAGLLAAVLNHPLFKPVKAIYRWAIGLLRKRIEKDHGEGAASDLDDTVYKGPRE